jgi:hypothetical protein
LQLAEGGESLPEDNSNTLVKGGRSRNGLMLIGQGGKRLKIKVLYFIVRIH